MGKFWPSSSGDRRNGSRRSEESPPPPPQGESSFSQRDHPDERTSLLPRQSRYHLNTNDPAVTPYNLLSVRALRWFSIILFIITAIWWLLLLITTFFTLPGFHTRGGGWMAFGFTTLTLAIELLLLLFYATPSKSERILLLSLLFFLSIDTLLILIPSPVRHAESWVGIASAVWSLFITIWTILCDRVVEYGKAEEEERLTGRPATRRSWSQFFSVVFGSATTLIFLLVSILFTVHLSVRARDVTLHPLGKKYPVHAGAYDIHLFCSGAQNNSLPTILLEAGSKPAESSLAPWIATTRVPRYCYWDRPGIGFSDNAPSPLSAGMAVDALSQALEAAEERGPWIIVAHGVGGVYARIFAARHKSEISGLLLVDTLPERLLNKLASPTRGFWLWFRGFMSPLGVDRIVSAVFLGRGREERVYGRDAWRSGGFIKAQLQENLVAGTLTFNEVVAAREILKGNVKTVVVSSGEKVKRSKEWADGQRELAKDAEAWDVVDGAGHEVWRHDEGRRVVEERLAGLLRGV